MAANSTLRWPRGTLPWSCWPWGHLQLKATVGRQRAAIGCSWPPQLSRTPPKTLKSLFSLRIVNWTMLDLMIIEVSLEFSPLRVNPEITKTLWWEYREGKCLCDVHHPFFISGDRSRA